MKALLLAAGLGTRLKPLTDVLPKCLAPIRGRPLLEYWLRLLQDGGIESVIVNTHHHADLVDRFVQEGPWRARVRLAHEPTLLGTGGTMLRHREALEDGPFLLVHADNLSSFDLGAFVERHRARPREALMTMMTFSANDPRSCGIVELDGSGLVTRFHEKVENPPGNLANAAVYIFEPAIYGWLAGRPPVSDVSTQVIPELLGRIAAWHNGVYHRDIGNLASWRAAQADYRFAVPAPGQPDAWSGLLADRPDIAARIKTLLAAA